jgi:hypothetical protein
MVVLGKQLDASNPCSRQEGARFALLVLTGINLLNFADRYVPSAVKELIKDDLDLTDTETTYPTTGMIFVYMVCDLFTVHIHIPSPSICYLQHVV